MAVVEPNKLPREPAGSITTGSVLGGLPELDDPSLDPVPVRRWWNLPGRLMDYLRREGWVSDRLDAVLFGFVVFAVVFIACVAVAFLLHLLPRGGTTIEVTCPAGQQPQVTNDDGRTTVTCLAPAPK